MKDLRLLLVEDDEEFTSLLNILLKKIGVGHTATAIDQATGWSEFQRFQPNICLIDIALGKERKGGIELAKRIREQDSHVKIIFMTSHFTEKDYEETKLLRPNSFMNKDLSVLKLKQAIELAWSDLKASQTGQPVVPQAGPAYAPKMADGKYFFKIGDSFKAIDLTEVSYFYAEGKMTFARIGNRNYPTNVQLKVLENGLSHNFLRCHKKYLVNIEKIISIKTTESKICLSEGTLPIGYAYRKSFLGRLNLLK
jgi:DNA-binding LytR/AlgR family response regulator